MKHVNFKLLLGLLRTSVPYVFLFVALSTLALGFLQFHGVNRDGHMHHNFHFKLSHESEAFWNSLHPIFECQSESLDRVGGAGIGGRWTCGLEYLGRQSLDNPQGWCNVYSFGTCATTSFESDLLSTTACQVFMYDSSMTHIMGPPLRPTNSRVHFESWRITNINGSSGLAGLMEKNLHEWVDILKLHAVHEADYKFLDGILDTFDELPIGQILISLTNLDLSVKADWIQHLIAELLAKEFALFYKFKVGGSKIYEFSFIRTSALELFLEEESHT